jgi:hypothetical protein
VHGEVPVKALSLVIALSVASPRLAAADETSLEACTDHVDNDSDGQIDCADPDCEHVCSLIVRAAAAPSTASAPSAPAPIVITTVPVVTSAPAAHPIDTTWVLASIGAHVGDFNGGTADLQFGFGGTSLWGIVGVHGAGGTGPASGNGFGVASSYLGIRTISRSASGLSTTASVAAGIGYIHEQEGDLVYQYMWPHARVSLGLLHGTGARPGVGLELVGCAGYAFEFGEFHYETDYSSFWKSLELDFTFSL